LATDGRDAVKPVIQLNKICFSYRVFKNHRTSLKNFVKEIFKGNAKLSTYIAISDISLSVFPGEVIGVIGKNGAGKSTLLKMLARVLPPSSGSLKIEGSVAPLIELGAGFHPEMSGRENVLLYSALLGRDVKEVKARIDTIAEWAGVLDHLDFPIRSFSSGMVARLAFATATDEGSDILLIDEILSVGDAEFQGKSKSRIQSLIQNGTTVIFVSHDLTMVKELCEKVLWIENGTVRMFGPTEPVLVNYENSQ
jgi:ABC-2 type transport system ATP-binding protein